MPFFFAMNSTLGPAPSNITELKRFLSFKTREFRIDYTLKHEGTKLEDGWIINGFAAIRYTDMRQCTREDFERFDAADSYDAFVAPGFVNAFLCPDSKEISLKGRQYESNSIDTSLIVF